MGGFVVCVVRKAKAFKYTAKLLVVCVADVAGASSLLPSTKGDGGSVAVTARNLKYGSSFCSPVSGKNIAGKKGGNVSDVKRSVGVRPCAADNDVIHKFYLISQLS